MRKFLFYLSKGLPVLLIVTLLSYGIAEAIQEIVVVQSIRANPFEESLKGFKSVFPSRITRIILSEEGEDKLEKRISRSQPHLILAIGQEALLKTRNIRNLPVVYLMVPNPQSVLSGEENISGVSMNIPEEKQINALLTALPDTQSIGLLYDPERSGDIVRRAQAFARTRGVKILAQPVRDAKNVPRLAMAMRRQIDVFWMLPDLTVVTPETVEFFVLFSLENKIPILTFSDKYVEMGAFMSMNIDAVDMGRQAGEMAKRILTGGKADRTRTAYARRAVVSTNMMVAGKLGIHTNLAANLDPNGSSKILRSTLKLDQD